MWLIPTFAGSVWQTTSLGFVLRILVQRFPEAQDPDSALTLPFRWIAPNKLAEDTRRPGFHMGSINAHAKYVGPLGLLEQIPAD